MLKGLLEILFHKKALGGELWWPVPNKPSRFCGRKAKWTHSVGFGLLTEIVQTFARRPLPQGSFGIPSPVCLKPKSNAGGCTSQGGIDKELWDCIFMFWGMLWGLVLQGSINKQFWYIYIHICAQTQLFCWKVLYLCCYRKLHQHQSPDYKPLLLWNTAALHITDLVCLHQQNCSLFSVTCGCFG